MKMKDLEDDIKLTATAIVQSLCCDKCFFMRGCGCFDLIASALTRERARGKRCDAIDMLTPKV